MRPVLIYLLSMLLLMSGALLPARAADRYASLPKNGGLALSLHAHGSKPVAIGIATSEACSTLCSAGETVDENFFGPDIEEDEDGGKQETQRLSRMALGLLSACLRGAAFERKIPFTLQQESSFLSADRYLGLRTLRL